MKKCLRPWLILLAFSATVSVASAQTPDPTSLANQKMWLGRAAQGNADAQFWLGTGYEQGWFGPPNFSEALKWLRKSAQQGNADAENCLGQMYENGEGVTQNYAMAANWYLKAAEHVPDYGGAGQGRNNLAMLYLDGRGVPQDYVRAYMWFKLTNYAGNLSIASSNMTREQILEAERLAAEWKRQHTQP